MWIATGNLATVASEVEMIKVDRISMRWSIELAGASRALPSPYITPDQNTCMRSCNAFVPRTQPSISVHREVGCSFVTCASKPGLLFPLKLTKSPDGQKDHSLCGSTTSFMCFNTECGSNDSRCTGTRCRSFADNHIKIHISRACLPSLEPDY